MKSYKKLLLALDIKQEMSLLCNNTDIGVAVAQEKLP